MLAVHSGFFGRLFTPYRSILALLFCSYVAAFIDRGLVSVAGAPIEHICGARMSPGFRTRKGARDASKWGNSPI
jgi:hypothetical protein